MNARHSYVALILTVAVLGGVACRSQKPSDDQKKVDELQAQLDDARQQLAAQEAAKQEAAKQEPAPPAEAAAADAAPPAAAGAPNASRNRSIKPGVPARLPAKGSAPDTSKEALAEQQRGVNDQQQQTNAQLQRQIDEMKPVEYTIPAGTVIPVRTTTAVSSSSVATGAPFDAVLERSLVVDGTVLARQGAHVTGFVVSSDPGGRVKGVASLEVTIRSIAGRRDQAIRVKADQHTVLAEKSTGRDAKRTGIMTGAGAIVGAIAGGGKGAAIGAGAGAATGVGTTIATRGKPAVIPAETLLEFRLASPATVVYQP
jgi:hypothetical protein